MLCSLAMPYAVGKGVSLLKLCDPPQSPCRTGDSLDVSRSLELLAECLLFPTRCNLLLQTPLDLLEMFSATGASDVYKPLEKPSHGPAGFDGIAAARGFARTLSRVRHSHRFSATQPCCTSPPAGSCALPQATSAILLYWKMLGSS